MRGNERDSEKQFQYESLRDKVKLLRQTMKTKESSEQPSLVLDWDGREPVSVRVSLAGPGSGGESEPGGRKDSFPRAM